MAAAIFNSGTVKILKNILKFKSNVQIVTGDSDDPSLVAKNYPQGSIYIQAGTGAVFVKQDAGSSTNWEEQVDTGSTQTLTNKTIDADSNTISNIDNDEIKAAAAIEVSKLEALTIDRALITDGSGFLAPSSVTSTELGYVSGVTSAIQTQLNTLSSTISNFEWQNSVLDKDLTTPPGAPSLGDRYLIGLDTTAGIATGAWAGHDGEIAEWNGASWDFTSGTVGMFVAVDDEPEFLYLFGGVVWSSKAFEATTASLGLTKVGFDIQTDPTLAGTGLTWTTGVIDIDFGTTGTRAVSADTLASTANGQGASLLGIEDSGAYFTATTVEGALAEIGPLYNRTDFTDDVFRISDDGDTSKKIAFQASAISAATVRTITMPDADVDLGQIATPVLSISTNTALAANSIYLVDTSGGPVTVTLPAPASSARVVIKDSTGSSNSNNITISPNAAEEIDGIAGNRIVDSNWDATVLVSDGTDWFII